MDTFQFVVIQPVMGVELRQLSHQPPSYRRLASHESKERDYG